MLQRIGRAGFFIAQYSIKTKSILSMAENKKSFLLYADQIGLFEKLSDEIAGKLIKMIFEYVNDRCPISDDILLQVAFEPIKCQLKRDLKDWEERKVERSESGRIGNLKRWHLDIYNKVKSGQLTINEAENIAKHRTAISPIANIAVNVNDNVNVNVNEKENTPPPLFRIEECLTVAMNDPRWVKANKVTNKDLQEFNAMLEKRGIYQKNPADYKTHYANWSAGGKKDEAKQKTKEEIEHEKLKAKLRG